MSTAALYQPLTIKRIHSWRCHLALRAFAVRLLAGFDSCGDLKGGNLP
jgi:hypothetical protein